MPDVYKVLGNGIEGEKYNYLHPFLERKCSFIPMVYPAYGVPGTEDVAAQRHLASLLSNKLKREYLEMCGFIRAWVSLAIVGSNTLILQGAMDNEAYIRQRPNLEDGLVIALMAP